jgi:short-subunit dehydrogenase
MREELLLDIVTLTELTRAYVRGMHERSSGRILNVASTAGFVPGPFAAVYYASKAYVLSFSQALAEELRGSGVTVTCLAPGATATGFAERAEMKRTLLFKLPMAGAAPVAKAGYRAMMAGKDLVIPGLSNKMLALSGRLMPRRAVLWISRKLIEQSP